MNRMAFKYGPEDIPPLADCILLGLQWLAIVVPFVIILGKVAAGVYSVDQVVYIQRLFFVSGLSLLVQVLWGHRLPLITGPATLLLVGIVASRGSDIYAVYSAMAIDGAILSVLGVTGLFGRLKRLFTPRVVATILILIALTLTPTILNLIIPPTGRVDSLANLIFAMVFVFLLFGANRRLTGIWKATLIIWAIIAGSLCYFFLFPQPAGPGTGETVFMSAVFLDNLNLHLTLEPGVLISFLVCFLALSINELGSIESVGEMVQAGDMQRRITRGISITGLMNVLAGFFGVIGPVDYSLSSGVIASTGVASRFPLIPSALGLLLLSFFPGITGILGAIPSVVIGASLIYIMCSQIAASLMITFNSMREFKFEYGLVIGLPVMLGIVISFLPATAVDSFPALLRPVLGNGFVVGTLSVLLMEHVIYREKASGAVPRPFEQ